MIPDPTARATLHISAPHSHWPIRHGPRRPNVEGANLPRRCRTSPKTEMQPPIRTCWVRSTASDFRLRFSGLKGRKLIELPAISTQSPTSRGFIKASALVVSDLAHDHLFKLRWTSLSISENARMQMRPRWLTSTSCKTVKNANFSQRTS